MDFKALLPNQIITTTSNQTEIAPQGPNTCHFVYFAANFSIVKECLKTATDDQSDDLSLFG